MAIYEHLTEYAGKPVLTWEPGEPLHEPEATHYRIALSWDEADEGGRWTEKFARFLDEPGSEEVTGLIVGHWEHANDDQDTPSEDIVAALVAAADRLPHLVAIFFGDIISEENEISWIEQCEVSPLLAAYPQLEVFGIRGGNGLSLGALHHERLRVLTIESGGLPAAVVREVGVAHLPALEHLELWLGTEQYGGDATVEDLAPILSGERFPALAYLGLRDSDITDAIAAIIGTAPIIQRIRDLDLSLGTLSDDGARALLASPAIRQLQSLDLHHHYCSEAVVAQLLALPMTVDVGERQEVDIDGGEAYRYVAVGE